MLRLDWTVIYHWCATKHSRTGFFFPRLIDHFLLHLATLSLSNLDNNESENQLFSCCIIRPRYTKCQNNRFLMLTKVFQSSWKFWHCESSTTNTKIFIKFILSTLFNSYYLSNISLLRKKRNCERLSFHLFQAKMLPESYIYSEQMCLIV